MSAANHSQHMHGSAPLTISAFSCRLSGHSLLETISSAEIAARIHCRTVISTALPLEISVGSVTFTGWLVDCVVMVFLAQTAYIMQWKS